MNAPFPTCQLVIPCYRDHRRLGPFLDDLIATLPASFVIQVVDDGSGPEEAGQLAETVRERAKNLRAGGPRLAEPLLVAENRGKGAAVRAGWARAGEADLVGFADADGAVSSREIRRGYDYFSAQLSLYDGLLGSRMKMLGRRVERSWWRHYCGRVFATAVSLFCGLPVYDSQCGFKLFKRESVEPLLSVLQSDRFSFDVELILELIVAGRRLKEFPVDWIDRAGSKVSVAREMFPMLLDVWQTGRRVRSRAR